MMKKLLTFLAAVLFSGGAIAAGFVYDATTSTITSNTGTLTLNGITVTTTNLGVGITNPDASALVDLTSTTSGFLFPRMTTTERDAISSPATGLVIYNTTLDKLQQFTGTVFETMGDNLAWTTYAPVISSESGGWTNVTATARFRVVNKRLEVSFRATFTGASASASQFYLSIPSALTIDTAAFAGGGGWDTDPIELGILGDSGTISGVPAIVNTRDSTRIIVKYMDDDDAGKIVSRTINESLPWVWANADDITGTFTVPVL